MNPRLRMVMALLPLLLGSKKQPPRTSPCSTKFFIELGEQELALRDSFLRKLPPEIAGRYPRHWIQPALAESRRLRQLITEVIDAGGLLFGSQRRPKRSTRLNGSLRVASTLGFLLSGDERDYDFQEGVYHSKPNWQDDYDKILQQTLVAIHTAQSEEEVRYTVRYILFAHIFDDLVDEIGELDDAVYTEASLSDFLTFKKVLLMDGVDPDQGDEFRNLWLKCAKLRLLVGLFLEDSRQRFGVVSADHDEIAQRERHLLRSLHAFLISGLLRKMVARESKAQVLKILAMSAMAEIRSRRLFDFYAGIPEEFFDFMAKGAVGGLFAGEDQKPDMGRVAFSSFVFGFLLTDFKKRSDSFSEASAVVISSLFWFEREHRDLFPDRRRRRRLEQWLIMLNMRGMRISENSLIRLALEAEVRDGLQL